MRKFLREIADSYRELFEGLMRAFGYEPESPAFENQLRMLFPTQADRDRFRDGVLLLAKGGIPAERFENLAIAFARGELTLDSPPIVHQFDGEPLSPAPSVIGAYDETKPSERR